MADSSLKTHSCLIRPAVDTYITIHQCDIDICNGNQCAAALITYFEHWHNNRIKNAIKTRQTNDVAERHGDTRSASESLLQWHTEAEIEDGIKIFRRTSIAEALKVLADKKIVTRQKNPNEHYKFDRTRFFLFHPDVVHSLYRSFYSSTENGSSSTENNGRSTENESAIELDSVLDPKKQKKNLVDVSPQTVSRESLAAEASVSYDPDTPKIVSQGRDELGEAEGDNLSTLTNLPLPEAELAGEDAPTTEGEVSKGGEALKGDAPSVSLPLTNNSLSPEGLIALYNELTPEKHPKIRQLSPGRLSKASKYLKMFPDPNFWRTVFTNIHYSQFLQGKRPSPGHRTYIADFERLLSRGKDGTETCVKVAEGKYTDPEFSSTGVWRDAYRHIHGTPSPADASPAEIPLEQPRMAQDDIWGTINTSLAERKPYAR